MRKNLSKDLTDIMIRLGLIAFLVYMSIRIFSPFMGLMLWAVILAVTLYPLHQKFANKLGGKQGLAATLIVLSGILLIGIPTMMLGASTADFVQDTYAVVEKGSFAIPAPSPKVAEWPLIGPKLHELWTLAANDPPALLKKMQPQLGGLTKAFMSFLAGIASGVFEFLFALIIAGIMMAFGQSGSAAMLRIARRLSGPDKGEGLYKLSTATIRSVSLGVIGVAFIQSLLLGVGFVWADVPAAGLLAIVVLIFGIAQLPAAVISLPVIAYVWWSGDSTMTNIFLSIYLLVAGLADNVLKPLMLGRGVDAPMPIILLGALGGMVTGGLIGLFVGAVLLALGYVIFMEWVAEGEVEATDQVVEEREGAAADQE
ncbi:AI-2E family transporter [Thiolapillus sp.]